MTSQQNKEQPSVIPILTLKSGPFKYKQKDSYNAQKKNPELVPG